MKHNTFLVNNIPITQRSNLRLHVFALTCILLMLAFGLNVPKAQAQTYAEKTLHSFTGGSDGSVPTTGLVNVNGILYGTTYEGGSTNSGTIFSVNPDGSGYQTLYTFGANSSTDGAYPSSSLLSVNVNSILYGTTHSGGTGLDSGGDGTLYSFDPATNKETTLYSFEAISSAEGGGPLANLTFINNIFYGTTFGGGANSDGTVFSFDPSRTSESALYSFTDSNGDGENPQSGLLAVNGLLYGTTRYGGSFNDGIVFSLDPKTGVEHILHQFTGTGLNDDGVYPYSGLVLLNNFLYGTTEEGGTSGDGTVYSINLSGSRYQVLYDFTDTLGDGSYPISELIAINGLLYGTTQYGGIDDSGTVFAVDPVSGDESILYAFGKENSNDGTHPYGGLININNTLYGTTENGGTSGDGTIFSLTPASLPTAYNDGCSIKYDTARTNAAPGVLGNDSNGGDGPLAASLVTNVKHGTMTLGSDGSFTYTPNTGYAGTDTFTYQAVNSIGKSNIATCTFTVIGTTPLARNDGCTIAHNKARTNAAPGVLGNDDSGGSPITAALVKTTTHGTLTLDSNGGFTYAPNTGYSGTDTFTYQAVNSLGKSNVATCTLTVQ